MIRLALALICLGGTVLAEPSLRPNGVMRWEIRAPWFGGWSGIEVTDQGRRMIVVSDRGQLTDATMERADNRLTGITLGGSRRLSDPSGARLAKLANDAEGLAVAPDGTVFVSFEHRHRIMQADPDTGRTSSRIDIPFADTLAPNSGVESLAVRADGTLYALGEKAPRGREAFPLYSYRNGEWRVSAQIPRRGPFVPVGADIDPSGRLWLLERTLTPLGFRSRIRLFVLDQDDPQEYTMMTSGPGHYDNLEGISVWQDAGGQLHVTMISDDNFFRIQRTQIVEFVVEE